MPTFDEAMALLAELTTQEVRAFMVGRLNPKEAEGFEVLTTNVSHEVLVFVSARALTRMAQARRGRDIEPRHCR